MAAEVESMFSVREVPWHGLGTIVSETLTSRDALEKAGLAWEVEYADITVNGQVYPDRVATVRASDKTVLGIVSPDYRIVQNKKAFEWTDLLVSGKAGDVEVKYETAGSLQNGKRVWIMAHLPKTRIVGDDVVPYLLFANSFDASMSVTACITPVRVVCANTLAMAIKGAPRCWRVSHTGDIDQKLAEAERTLSLAASYMDEFPVYAEYLSGVSVYEDEIKKFIEELFPLPKAPASMRAEANVIVLRNTLERTYRNTPDLGSHRGTAWGLYNAVTDMVTHMTPLRKTETYQENLFINTVMEGHPIIQKAQGLLMKIQK